MLLSKLFSQPSFSPTRMLIAVSLSTASIVGAAAPASAAACQAGPTICVLPVGTPAPAPPPPEAPPAIVDEGEGGFLGLGWLPLLIGLAALAGLLWLLLDEDEEEEPDPISP